MPRGENLADRVQQVANGQRSVAEAMRDRPAKQTAKLKDEGRKAAILRRLDGKK